VLNFNNNTWFNICIKGQNEGKMVIFICILIFNMRYALVQLVEALRYKPEGRGLDSRWCHWNLPLT
jgi:hypothetical protein